MWVADGSTGCMLPLDYESHLVKRDVVWAEKCRLLRLLAGAEGERRGQPRAEQDVRLVNSRNVKMDVGRQDLDRRQRLLACLPRSAVCGLQSKLSSCSSNEQQGE